MQARPIDNMRSLLDGRAGAWIPFSLAVGAISGFTGPIERTFRRKVTLACKGHIVIEQTEGLVAIDVNSGRFVGDRNVEQTAFRTNCEAAREIARQIRLRDMGGIIIIDFIDMARGEHRKKVYRILEEAVKRDRAKTTILQTALPTIFIPSAIH